MTVITVVEGEVSPEKQHDFEQRFHDLEKIDFPDGLLDTTLLQDIHHPDRYCIETTWENMEKLEKMRSETNIPTAVDLFKQMGTEPEVSEFAKAEEFTVTCTP
jgi:quinol monooxygenase YgiN